MWLLCQKVELAAVMIHGVKRAGCGISILAMIVLIKMLLVIMILAMMLLAMLHLATMLFKRFKNI